MCRRDSIKDNHPAIIPRDIYQRVQEEMARRTSKRKILQKSGKTEQGKYSAKYALSERLVCGECGSPYKPVSYTHLDVYKRQALGRARTPPAWGAMARAFAMTLFGYTMRHLAWPARKTGGAALELKAVETPGKSPCGFLPEADPYCSPSSGGELRIRREQTAKQLTYSNRRFYK